MKTAKTGKKILATEITCLKCRWIETTAAAAIAHSTPWATSNQSSPNNGPSGSLPSSLSAPPPHPSSRCLLVSTSANRRRSTPGGREIRDGKTTSTSTRTIPSQHQHSTFRSSGGRIRRIGFILEDPCQHNRPLVCRFVCLSTSIGPVSVNENTLWPDLASIFHCYFFKPNRLVYGASNMIVLLLYTLLEWFIGWSGWI